MTLLKIPQHKLRTLASNVTQARVGLNRSGASLSTKEILKFNLDHALARDAIHKTWNVKSLKEECGHHGWKAIELHSKISTIEEYLLNPPYGGLLNKTSEHFLENEYNHHTHPDLCIIVSNGLSSIAINDHFVSFFKIFYEKIKNMNLILSPIVLVPFGRVSISDHIGMLMHAKISVIFIGERPGLSAHNSMGIYTTVNPKVGCSNADRRCISNIRPPFGLNYEDAVKELVTHLQAPKSSIYLQANVNPTDGR